MCPLSMLLLIGTDGKVAQTLIGDSQEDAVRVHHTIVRKIVEPDAK